MLYIYIYVYIYTYIYLFIVTKVVNTVNNICYTLVRYKDIIRKSNPQPCKWSKLFYQLV